MTASGPPFVAQEAGRWTLPPGADAEDDVEKEDPMDRRTDLMKCPRCGVDMAIGESERRSRWASASLPPDLDEYCDTCRLSFFTCEVNRPGGRAIIPKHVRDRRTRVLTSASS
jgi:hypothetical protein